MKSNAYLTIAKYYEQCLEKYGDTHKGVDWPNPEDAETRYRVMLEVMKTQQNETVTLLDFGCGTSHLYDYIQQNNLRHITYSGLDISPEFIEVSRQKYPNIQYYCLDILKDSDSLPQFDYIIINGVFTEKLDLPFNDMLDFFKAVIRRVYPKARRGIAFNVMSKQVDWERDDLFHLPLDTLANFLTKELTRNFLIRFDYGLYEYTTYVYSE